MPPLTNTPLLSLSQPLPAPLFLSLLPFFPFRFILSHKIKSWKVLYILTCVWRRFLKSKVIVLKPSCLHVQSLFSVSRWLLIRVPQVCSAHLIQHPDFVKAEVSSPSESLGDYQSPDNHSHHEVICYLPGLFS